MSNVGGFSTIEVSKKAWEANQELMISQLVADRVGPAPKIGEDTVTLTIPCGENKVRLHVIELLPGRNLSGYDEFVEQVKPLQILKLQDIDLDIESDLLDKLTYLYYCSAIGKYIEYTGFIQYYDIMLSNVYIPYVHSIDIILV